MRPNQVGRGVVPIVIACANGVDEGCAADVGSWAKVRILLLGVGICFGMLGCSTTSTISRLNGPDVEGDIVGGSPDSIFVAGDSGHEVEIRRDDIASIDYPGNVHTGIGAGVLAYGVLNIAVGVPKCDEQKDNQAAYCVGVFLPAALGAAIMTWGLIVNQSEHAGQADRSRASSLGASPDGGRYPSWSSGHRAPVAPAAPPAASAAPATVAPVSSAPPPGAVPSAAPPAAPSATPARDAPPAEPPATPAPAAPPASTTTPPSKSFPAGP